MDTKPKQVFQNLDESTQKAIVATRRLSTAMNKMKDRDRIARNKRKKARQIKYRFIPYVKSRKTKTSSKSGSQRYFIVRGCESYLIVDNKPNSKEVRNRPIAF